MATKVKEPQYYISKINSTVLNYNVYVMKPLEKLLYSLLLLLAGGAAGLIFYGGLFKKDGQTTLLTIISNVIVFVVVGLLAVKSILPAVAESLQRKRTAKLKKQFCDFASALANALAGGMNMNDSLYAAYNDLQSQYSEESFIVQEVAEIINGMHNNIPVEVMVEDFGRRSGVMDIVNFATVFSTCYRTGGDIKSIVRRTTDIISEKIMISSEIDTVMTSNRLQLSVMTALPLVIVFMMRMTSSDFAESFSTVIGVIGLTVSAGLTIAAYRLGKKITSIKG